MADRISELHASYEALSLPDAAREAERLYGLLYDAAMRLGLLYDAQPLNAIQPADDGGAITQSLDEWAAEISHVGEHWGNVATMIEEEADGFYLVGRFERSEHEGELRGPYLKPDQPEDWAARGYRDRNGRCVRVTSAELLDRIKKYQGER